MADAGGGSEVVSMRQIWPVNSEGPAVVFETFADADALSWRNVAEYRRPNRNVSCGGDMVARNTIVQDGVIMGADAG